MDHQTSKSLSTTSTADLADIRRDVVPARSGPTNREAT